MVDAGDDEKRDFMEIAKVLSLFAGFAVESLVKVTRNIPIPTQYKNDALKTKLTRTRYRKRIANTPIVLVFVMDRCENMLLLKVGRLLNFLKMDN